MGRLGRSLLPVLILTLPAAGNAFGRGGAWVPLSEVPAAVMQAAREAVPGARWTEAILRGCFGEDHELIGNEADGRPVSVFVSSWDGTEAEALEVTCVGWVSRGTRRNPPASLGWWVAPPSSADPPHKSSSRGSHV
jgi:hypothetical protein